MGSVQNRWILVEFIPIAQGTAQLGKSTITNSIDGKAIWSALKQSVLNNFGDTGWGAVGLSLTGMQILVSTSSLGSPDQFSVFKFTVKYFSPTTNICIIRVARDQHNIAWGALTLLTSIEGTRYLPNVVHVSGNVFCLRIHCHNFDDYLGTIRHAQLAAIAHNREVIARYRTIANNPGTRLCLRATLQKAQLSLQRPIKIAITHSLRTPSAR